MRSSLGSAIAGILINEFEKSLLGILFLYHKLEKLHG